MPPAHNAEGPILIVNVLDDVLGMTQRKLQLMTPHGEDATQAAGNGVVGAAVVSTVGSSTSIADHVDAWNNAQAGVEKHGGVEQGLIVSLA